ncbi:MAG: ABC transporter ATP-binding protein [Bacilli bacterium]|nr:ABC transporter ATP-binding protein [Bacilli bacterium]
MYIELKNVDKIYKMGEIKIKAADNVTFGIEKGELAVVLGPSGAGKTTVLNILGGMDKCDNGQVFVDGKDITKYNNKDLIKYRRNDIGFVFQFYNLVQNLTSIENIELTNQICKDTLPAEQVLTSVGLKNRINNFPAQLSGGEQQRVAIARAIAKKPKLLLCDEPTGALDSKTGKKVLEVLQNVCEEYEITVVIITHNSIISQLANRIIKMKNGTIEEITINKKPKDIKEIDW